MSNGLERSQFGTQNNKIRLNGLERSQLGLSMMILGQMVWKGMNWVHNDKFWSNGLARNQ